jgi:hypothetical protein
VTDLVLNSSIYFLTMDGNITRCLDGQPHSVPTNVHNHQLDVRPNNNSFTAFSTQDQHGVLLLSAVEPVQFFRFRPVLKISLSDRQISRASITTGSLEQPTITVNRPLAQALLPFGACEQTSRCHSTAVVQQPGV